MKGLRIIGIVVGLVLVILIAGAAALLIFVDPNDYKDQITQVVKEQTGRELTIGGEMELSVFPWLGLEINQVSLSNAAGFEANPFAQVKEVGVQVRLLPLLRREVEMSTLRLAGLQLYLGVDKQGTPNWADMIKAAEKPAPAEEPAQDKGAALGALAIGGVEVTDAVLVWDDRQAGAKYEIRDLDLTLSEVAPDQPIDFSLDFDLAMDQPPMQGEAALRGVLGISSSLQQFDVSDMRLEVAAEGEGLPGGKIDTTLTTQAAVDLERQTLQVSDLVLEALGLKVEGQVSGQDIQGEAPQFKGSLAVNEFVPRDLIKRLGQPVPEVSDASVLGKADASLDFSAGLDRFAAQNLQVRIDDSTLKGSASARNFAQPAIGFDLTLDQIDLDRYLPPPSEEGEVKAAPTPGEAAAAGAGAIPVDTLRTLNLDGTVRIGELKAYQLRSSDVRVTVKARDGLVRVHPAEASLYEGAYQGDITLDARPDTPKISLNEKLQGVQAGPLLKDMLGKEQLVGTANVSADLDATGATPDALKKTLNGNAAFSFEDGAVKGINVARLIRQAKARLEGKSIPEDKGPNQTDFTELKGTAQVKNGVVRNDDLSLMSPLLRVNGEGTADLPEEQVDYLLTVKLVGSLEGQGGAQLKELKGVAIPLRIKGPFDKPGFRVELQEVVKDAVKEKAKQKVEEKVEEKLKDKLDDKVKDQLKGIFGR